MTQNMKTKKKTNTASVAVANSVKSAQPKSPISNLKSQLPNPSPVRRLEEIARGRAGCFPITPTLIRPETGFNSREDLGDLKALAADIEANGLLQPLKIRKEPGTENIFLIDGHRRHTAITTILIPQGRWPMDKEDPSLPAPVECTAEKRGTTRLDRLFMQLSMNTGKPFTFLEEACHYLRILKEDSTLKAADIARRTGKTKQAISDSLRLVNDGCHLIIENVRMGTLAASTAVQIIKQAGADTDAQESLFHQGLATATAAGRSHIMPKDLGGGTSTPTPPRDPSTPEPTTPEESENDPPPSPPDQKSSIKNPQSSIPSSLSLYVIEGAPEDPPDEAQPFYHETDRFVLTHPGNFGLNLLHLLCASTGFGVAYGFRINDYERLPDVGHLETLDTSPEDGFKAMLAAALKHADRPDLNEPLHSILYDALCDYFPEEGNPKEAERIRFVATPNAQPENGSNNPGFQQTLNSPSGGGSGCGVSAYLDPQTYKAVEKIEKVLEELSGKNKGIEERVTVADICIGVLRNERPASDLRNYLLGK